MTMHLQAVFKIKLTGLNTVNASENSASFLAEGVSALLVSLHYILSQWGSHRCFSVDLCVNAYTLGKSC